MADRKTSWFRRHRRLVRRLLLAVVLIVGVVICFMPGLIAPWSRLNNQEQEIDLWSGRARFTDYFLYCRIGQRIHETPLSKVLGADHGQGDEQRWVMVNILQPDLRHSPHFTYHGALAQTQQLATHWDMDGFTPAARQKTAGQLLRVLREGGDYHAGSRYFEQLREVIAAREAGKPITADDVPDDLADRALAAHGMGETGG